MSNINIFLKKFSIVRKDYTDNCIYNLDETALYIKGGSQYSYNSKDLDRKNTKQDKTRITLLLGVSMAGEKLKTLIIEKSKNHRAFKTFL